jgi:hypothetical protein
MAIKCVYYLPEITFGTFSNKTAFFHISQFSLAYADNSAESWGEERTNISNSPMSAFIFSPTSRSKELAVLFGRRKINQ